MGPCARMNAGEGDCRYISTLYGAYTMAGRVVYRQPVYMASWNRFEWGLVVLSPPLRMAMPFAMPLQDTGAMISFALFHIAFLSLCPLSTNIKLLPFSGFSLF